MKRNKLTFILVLILFIVLLLGSYWYFFVRDDVKLTLSGDKDNCQINFQVVSVEPQTGYSVYYENGINRNFLAFSIDPKDRNTLNIYIADFYRDLMRKSADKDGYEVVIQQHFNEAIKFYSARADIAKCSNIVLEIDI